MRTRPSHSIHRFKSPCLCLRSCFGGFLGPLLLLTHASPTPVKFCLLLVSSKNIMEEPFLGLPPSSFLSGAAVACMPVIRFRCATQADLSLTGYILDSMIFLIQPLDDIRQKEHLPRQPLFCFFY
ncbi:hypothetical protein U0070_026660 [Myodes glareolus]|uniref:Secreted protein n=1 Tax=Myodes glareolus TaxID=447135 RepID=A0AAW0JKY8_MYOGA